MRGTKLIGFIVAVVAAGILLLSCGGGSSTSGSSNTAFGSGGSAMVSLSLSDPSTCSGPQGPFSHVYVTVTDVLINQSASASDSDSGWVDLAPNLKNNPMQVDLLGAATQQCFLANLGSLGIQPGTYQQIRVILADNSATVAGNKCGSTANCVMLTSDPTNAPQPLLLSSESKTGIKIPSGQIAGGQLVVAAGQTIDLNIDFNACASIVTEGNGKYRLKPVLHAGEVAVNSTEINGTFIDTVTGLAVVGGTTVVALEQKDSAGVDRVVMETLAQVGGGFTFCPVATGTYDVVAVAVNGTGTIYAATVITGVQPGNSLGTVPLTPAAAPASITGQITTSTGSAATPADLAVSALQSVGTSLLVTVPLAEQSAATATLTTAPGAGCPANTDCATYTLGLPASSPSVGAFNTTGSQQPAPPMLGTGSYTIDAEAFVPGSAGQADCNPSDLQTSLTNTNSPLTVTTGSSVTAATLAFTGCQ
jgi:hypothetical protein